MSIYGISNVTLNHAGEVTEAQIAEFDPETKQPGNFEIKPAHEIASMIIGGSDVRGIFLIDDKNILGAKFVPVVKDGGRETIELELNEMGWGINDVSWREV